MVAKKLGIPFDNLLVATNENRVLVDVFETGTYSTENRKLVKTLSCAMVKVKINCRLIFAKITDAESFNTESNLSLHPRSLTSNLLWTGFRSFTTHFH